MLSERERAIWVELERQLSSDGTTVGRGAGRSMGRSTSRSPIWARLSSVVMIAAAVATIGAVVLGAHVVAMAVVVLAGLAGFVSSLVAAEE